MLSYNSGGDAFLTQLDNSIMKLSQVLRSKLDSIKSDLDAMDELINHAQGIIESQKQEEEKWIEEYSAWAD